MDLLGIGPLELLLVLIMILLIFGPEDLATSGKKIGKFLNKTMKSDTWKAIRSIGKDIRTLPNKLAREAEIESYLAENPEKTIAPPALTTKKTTESPPSPKEVPFETGLKAWTTPPSEKPTEEEK
jgi:Sec-independent protein translocase protein TatA